MIRSLLVLSLLALPSFSSEVLAQKQRGDQAWAKGVAYTTNWKEAIKSARESGKMLLIYNGWQRSGI